MLCLGSAFAYQARGADPWLYPRGELNAMKRHGCASCAIYRKSFPGPSWCMRSADHSSRQRRDGPSIHIGATTQSGPINSPARSLPLAASRKDGCGASESKNRGHWLVFGCPPPRFANRPIRRAQATAVCAASPYFGSAGIATFGATGAQIRTLHGTVVALRLGTYGLRRAIMSGT
jgi:hypothetical protein